MANNEEAAIRILVIDDATGMRQGCQRALRPLGYEVEAVPDLASARAVLEAQDYQLFLHDVMLPDGSGLDLVEPILDRDPDAICIVMTGYGTVELAVDAVRQGAYDFLSKPFTSDELVVAVEQGIERRRLKQVEVQASELRRAKKELEQLDALKSQFMLKVSHELRAPVAAVQSYVNLIIAGYVTEDEMKPTLERVRARLQELLDLIADLLELARLTQISDLPAARCDPQPMDSVLEEVLDLLGKQARERRQSLEINIRDRPTVMADRKHLKQLWMNLISNAIKYTPQGGRITVTLRHDSGYAIGTVEDSGIGISGDDQTRLFREFFRSDRARASGEIGTGLGLSIVKQIVDQYGGEIEVISAPDKGSLFTFRLPAEPPSTSLPAWIPADSQS